MWYPPTPMHRDHGAPSASRRTAAWTGTVTNAATVLSDPIVWLARTALGCALLLHGGAKLVPVAATMRQKGVDR